LYRIDLPNSIESTKLITDFLVCLGNKFNTPKVKIDKVVANAGRIFKLYGTVANKGPNTTNTPHRLSELIDAPKTMKIISGEMLLHEAPLSFLSMPPPHIKQFPEVVNPIFDFSFVLKFLD
jgi:hypothetical protein